VNIGLLDVGLLLDAVSDFKVSALVISAVGAADELLELSLVGEPSLKVELLGSSVVCRPFMSAVFSLNDQCILIWIRSECC